MDFFGFVADTFNVSVDQVIFFSTQVVSVILASVLRIRLSPSNTSCTNRHIFGATVGLVLLYWCYGWYLLHMVAQCLGVYAIMMLLPQHLNYKIAFIFAMGYLTYVQITRIRGLPSFSSPVMVSTTKLTGLVFSVHDGVHMKKEKLSVVQQKYAVGRYPSFLEIFGYIFHFSGLICGPTFFFRDYMDFIAGENYSRDHDCNQNNNSNWKLAHRQSDIFRKIDPTKEVVKKILNAIVCLLINLFITSKFPVALNGDTSFINSHGLLYRFMYLQISMMLLRYRYYFVWVMGEAVQNAAGLGLHFVDGKPEWDLTANVNILRLDTAKSFKEIADNWNIGSAKWLRHVSYERTGKYRLPITYVLSSIWHGIEPGYYFTFLSIVPVTIAAKKVRRTIRPYFVGTRWKPWYDVLTGISAWCTINYAMGGFHLLHLKETFQLFNYSMYWWIHILVLVIIIVPVPMIKSKEIESPHDVSNLKKNIDKKML